MTTKVKSKSILLFGHSGRKENNGFNAHECVVCFLRMKFNGHVLMAYHCAYREILSRALKKKIA